MRRIPLRFQLTKTECGLACLAMVLSSHGRATTVPDCRELLGAGRDGVSVAELAEAAEAAGLDVHIERSVEPFQTPLNGPAIAYFARNHFVVVTRADHKWVSVVDPAMGRIRLPRAEFDQRYGGVMLHLTPTPRLRPRRIPLRDLPMMRYLRMFVSVPGGLRMVLLSVLVAVGLQALGLALPLLTKAIVDDVLPGHQVDAMPMLGAGIAGVVALYGTLTVLRGLALLGLRRRADRVLTRNLVARLFRLPMGFFLDRGRGDLLMRLASVSTSREMISQQLLTMVLDGFLLIGYLIGLVVLSPTFVLVLLPVFGAHLAMLAASHRRLGLLAQRELTAKSEEQSYLVEAMEAVVPLKANGVEARAVSRWDDLFGRYQSAMLTRGRATALLTGGQQALSVLGPLLLLWVGAWLVLDGGMSLGLMLAANAIALSVLAPLDTFANAGQMYHSVRAQVERLFDVLDTPTETTGTVRLPGDRPSRIDVHNLTFRYHPAQAPVLSGISFELPAGRKLGIVGRTGSGKSTLGLLLLGLLRTEAGAIYHDDIPLSRLDIHDLRSRCGAVLQELNLFNGTIRDNLALGRPDASQAEIVRAAQLAGLHDDVLRLPMGYETVVGEGGTSLSAGQRQRVALARALVHRPRLLILDEATSHLDPETERQVDEALQELAVTRVVISHRLNAIRTADHILVLDGGRIVQQGHHDDLIREDGPYRVLFGDAKDVLVAGR